MSLLENGYAEALYEAAGGESAAVGEELSAFGEALNGGELFRKFFNSPVVPREEKRKVIDEIFPPDQTNEKREKKIARNFLMLLIDNKRFGLLPAIAGIYSRLLPENRDKKHIKIFSAKPLGGEDISALEKKYSGGAPAETEIIIDPSLIGGVCVQTGDMRYDGTLKTKLKRLSEKLTQSRV